MKWSLLTVFLVVLSFSSFGLSSEQFLSVYFAKEPATTTSLSAKTRSGAELMLATEDSPVQTRGIERAVVYAISKGKVKLLLQVAGPMVFDGAGVCLVEMSQTPRGFCGWKIVPGKSTEKDRRVYLVLSVIVDEGRSESDPFNLVWDSASESFKLYEIDPAEY